MVSKSEQTWTCLVSTIQNIDRKHVHVDLHKSTQFAKRTVFDRILVQYIPQNNARSAWRRAIERKRIMQNKCGFVAPWLDESSDYHMVPFGSAMLWHLESACWNTYSSGVRVMALARSSCVAICGCYVRIDVGALIASLFRLLASCTDLRRKFPITLAWSMIENAPLSRPRDQIGSRPRNWAGSPRWHFGSRKFALEHFSHPRGFRTFSCRRFSARHMNGNVDAAFMRDRCNWPCRSRAVLRGRRRRPRCPHRWRSPPRIGYICL